MVDGLEARHSSSSSRVLSRVIAMIILVVLFHVGSKWYIAHWDLSVLLIYLLAFFENPFSGEVFCE